MKTLNKSSLCWKSINAKRSIDQGHLTRLKHKPCVFIFENVIIIQTKKGKTSMISLIQAFSIPAAMSKKNHNMNSDGKEERNDHRL